MIRVERMNLDKAAAERFGHGFITVEGKTYKVDFFEDVIDLAELMELIVLRHSGKVVKKRPRFVDGDRERLRVTTARCVPLEDYAEPAPIEAGFYLELGIGDSLYHNYFQHAEDLVRCLWNMVNDERVDGIFAGEVAGAH